VNWQFLSDNLPHGTALLNVIATILLVRAFLAIRAGKVRRHKKLMLSALGVSALFLILYLFHKVALYQTTGEPNTRFPTDPAVASTAARYIYFAVLIPHLLLAMLVPFLAVRAVYLAKQGRIIAHKKLVKYAYPIWLYVSVTGVVVYLMLHQIYVDKP
jgi:putative membrane protein